MIAKDGPPPPALIPECLAQQYRGPRQDNLYLLRTGLDNRLHDVLHERAINQGKGFDLSRPRLRTEVSTYRRLLIKIALIGRFPSRLIKSEGVPFSNQHDPYEWQSVAAV